MTVITSLPLSLASSYIIAFLLILEGCKLKELVDAGKYEVLY